MKIFIQFSLLLILGSIVAIHFSLASSTTKNNQLSSPYNPIIFIPGDGGSQLEAKLNKPDRVSYLCDLVSDWYDLWLNIHLLTPFTFNCLIDNMRLQYNRTTHKTSNSPGVEIRAANFGSLDSVDYLDIVRMPLTDYFDEIITTLEKEKGFIRNVDMVAAPFDFRKAPNELEEFFKNLTNLIESHYINNNYKPVTLICHSMGCLNSLYLLNRQSENWKAIFIKRLITLGAPFDGSFKAISAMLFGDNLGIPLLNSDKLQMLQSTFPSLMYLFPKSPTFEPNRVLVQSEEANYTLENLDKLFEATGKIEQKYMWHDTRIIAGNLTAPNVEMWCLYGAGYTTPSKIVFNGPIENKNTKYKEIQSDGDGTVNLESLRACESFASQQEKPLYTRQFDNVDHITILRGKDASQFISTQIIPLDLEGSIFQNNNHLIVDKGNNNNNNNNMGEAGREEENQSHRERHLNYNKV